ncbi:MAG: tetratricopeptide repeat protein [Cyanobacteriota bacterium]
MAQKEKQHTIKIIKKAQLEFDLENYLKSIELYEKAINRDRKNFLLYYESGVTKMVLKDYNGAISTFSKAIKINPNFDPPYLQRARALIEIGNYKKALEDCNQVINTKTNDLVPFWAYLIRGSVFIHLQKYDRALYEFELAFQIKPDFPLIYSCKAEAYCYLGRYETAFEYAQKAQELDRDFHLNILWEGWANYGLSKLEEALDCCNRYLEKDDKNPKAFEIRGLIYKENKQYDDALKDLKLSASLYKEMKLTSFYKEVCKYIQEITEII